MPVSHLLSFRSSATDADGRPRAGKPVSSACRKASDDFLDVSKDPHGHRQVSACPTLNLHPRPGLIDRPLAQAGGSLTKVPTVVALRAEELPGSMADSVMSSRTPLPSTPSVATQ